MALFLVRKHLPSLLYLGGDRGKALAGLVTEASRSFSGKSFLPSLAFLLFISYWPTCYLFSSWSCFLAIKFPKLEWERQAKPDSSSGHIPSSSCPSVSPSNKLGALNKMKAGKFSVDVSVPPTKSAYTHSKQRTRPEVSLDLETSSGDISLN